MSRKILFFSLMLALVLAGCATSAHKVEVEQEIPQPAEGEVAVFGGIRLVEEIGIFMPTEDQDGSVYFASEAEDRTYKVVCSDKGEFGVFLPPGRYRVETVDVFGYSFDPEDLTLVVPKEFKGVYAGIIELDGTPAGVETGTDKTLFVYSVLDESRQFVDALKRQAPGTERDVVKSLFVANGALSTGSYPTKVFRAKDLERDLSARKDAVEEFVGGGIIALSYVINPVWLFTLP